MLSQLNFFLLINNYILWMKKSIVNFSLYRSISITHHLRLIDTEPNRRKVLDIIELSLDHSGHMTSQK